MFRITLACAILFLAVQAYRVPFETGARESEHWELGQRGKPTETLEFVIALKQQNVDRLEAMFWDVSNPKSSNYAQYLSLDELHALLAPKPEAVSTVTSWIKNAAKLVSLSFEGEYIRVEMSLESAESVFGVKFHEYTHKRTQKRIIRSPDTYSLPSEVAEHVDLVFGIKHYPGIKPPAPRPSKRSAEGLYVTPTVIRKQYKVGNVAGKAVNNSQNVAQFIGQYYSPGDLVEFFDLFWPASKGNTPKVIGPNKSPAGLEASLDIQYIMSVGQGISTVFWSNEGENANQEPFLTWLLAMDKTADAPLVNSVSYGDTESSITSEYADRVEVEFKKQGVRGLSILFASGDSGVGGSAIGCSKFAPDWPATSPSITAVGGSTLGLFSSIETAAGLSSGGFSNYFAQPAYQAKQVKSYLSGSGSLPASHYYNATGRGFPDVAALAEGFVIVYDRITTPEVAGTSCAAPTFSGIMALLNDLRLQAGKPSLGFLNPLFYQLAEEHPDAFFDVTSGSNPGCGTEGFEARKGWDPVTGLGTPVYEAMAKYIVNL